MPIATTNVISQYMRTWMDEDYEGFYSWPMTTEEVINNWANVAELLLSTVIPVSVTSASAKQAFKTTMAGLTYASNGILLLQSAFLNYAVTLAAGMGPSFVGVPPPSLPPFVLTGLVTKSASMEAANIASTLVGWAKTGTATNVSSGSVIPWQ